MAKTFVFFSANSTHFYIQPEGLWQIMCQGFMMWDVIGPPSWWSKWMCISQWHPHICLATNEHASHSVSHSYWPNSLYNFVHIQMQCLSKHNFQQLVFHSYRVTIEWSIKHSLDWKSGILQHACIFLTIAHVKLIFAAFLVIQSSEWSENWFLIIL